jgi:hypothetical protein
MSVETKGEEETLSCGITNLCLLSMASLDLLFREDGYVRVVSHCPSEPWNGKRDLNKVCRFALRRWDTRVMLKWP